MSLDDKLLQRRLKLKEQEKKPVNRKALLVLFLATGLFSLFFWWRGRVIRETPPLGMTVESRNNEVASKEEQNKDRQATALRLAEQRLVEQMEELTATASGRYAVAVTRLNDGSGYGFNQKDRMPAASLMKVPVMVAAWREISAGRLDLSDVFTLDEADRATGSGPLQFRSAGSEYTVEELLTYLGKNSDNTAWVMFNRRLGKKLMNETMAEMGMVDSSYNELITTAADVTRMFEYINNGRAGGARSREEIFEYLSDSIYEDRIPAGVIGEEWKVVAHKVGTDAGVWTDAGIVQVGDEMLVIVILNQEVKRAEALTMVPDLVRRVCEFEANRMKTR